MRRNILTDPKRSDRAKVGREVGWAGGEGKGVATESRGRGCQMRAADPHFLSCGTTHHRSMDKHFYFNEVPLG